MLSQGPVRREEDSQEEPAPSAAGTAGVEDGESTADWVSDALINQFGSDTAGSTGRCQ